MHNRPIRVQYYVALGCVVLCCIGDAESKDLEGLKVPFSPFRPLLRVSLQVPDLSAASAVLCCVVIASYYHTDICVLSTVYTVNKSCIYYNYYNIIL